jgi:hypothetical protein
MEKELLAKQTWKIKDTDINYFVYKAQNENSTWFEVEILKETFRLRKDAAGNWTDLEGATSHDIVQWGTVVDQILKTRRQ